MYFLSMVRVKNNEYCSDKLIAFSLDYTVIKNTLDLNAELLSDEGYYNYAVIEKANEGIIINCIKQVGWFELDKIKFNYAPCKTPLPGICNFAIG